jgi:hemoglobin
MRTLLTGSVTALILLAAPAVAGAQQGGGSMSHGNMPGGSTSGGSTSGGSMSGGDHAMGQAAPVAATQPATASKSLFERLGGQPAIDAVIDDFAGNVLADQRINKKFARTNKPRLVAMLKSFVCSATGGPCQYTGLSMKDSHRNMAVTDAEFGALVEDLVKSLDKFKVPEQEKGELLAALGPLGPDIIEVHTDATGTPLPKNFKPAPPLNQASGTTNKKPATTSMKHGTRKRR